MNAGMPFHDEFRSRSVLVTGAAGGIGAAVSNELGERGAHVLGVDLEEGELADGAPILPCDLADPDRVHELFDVLRERSFALDGLVHCAGITRDGVGWKLTDEDWRRVLAVNLDSAFYLLREAAPLLRDHGGSVVLVSSINGERGKFGQSNYAASKAGLIGLARSAARELGRFDVRVNVIAPGLIRTAMTDALPPAIVDHALEETALCRLGEPEDVARAAYFLLSDLSRHVTGQVLRVDGGQLTA